MVTRNAIESINYLRKVWGSSLPIYNRHETKDRRFPCIVYSKTAACIIDVDGTCKYECAYVTDATEVIYVDGGWKKEGFGIIGIWYGDKDPRNTRMVTLECIDSFDCEVLALCRVLEREWFTEAESIEIRTDNRTACGIFHNDNQPAIKETPIVERFKELISRFPKRHRLNVAWIKGHSTWEGNNKADELTKLHQPKLVKEPEITDHANILPPQDVFIQQPQPYAPMQPFHPFPFQVYNNIQLSPFPCLVPPPQHPLPYNVMPSEITMPPGFNYSPPCYAF